MTCHICGHESRPVFTATVLRKYRVQYHQCPDCEFVQTETPYWLEEAYSSSITLYDTGLLSRNMHFARSMTSLLSVCFPRDARGLDYAGGYGAFTRMMRDAGFDFTWNDRYTENLLARGFEHTPGTRVDVVTAFEVLEHLPRPVEDLSEMLKFSRTLVFSTTLLPTPLPAPETWQYYVLDYGQHVSLYSRRSLERLASRFGLRLLTNGRDLHMLTDRSISPWTFRFLTGRVGRMLSPVVSLRRTRRTETDMQILQDRVRSTDAEKRP